MDKSVHSAKVYEYSVIGDVLYYTLQYLAFLQLADELGTLLLLLCLEEGLVGYYHVAELLVDLDNLEVDWLVYIYVIISDGLDVDLAARKECLDSEHVHDHTALRAGLYEALYDLAAVVGLVNSIPRLEGAGLLVRYHKLSLLVLSALYEHFYLVSDLEVRIVTEFRSGDDALALSADGNDNLTLVD